MSCILHEDKCGNPGQFVYYSDQVGANGGCWSCCGQTWEGAPGCSTRPHTSKDIMVSIRADSNTSFAMRGLDITVFKALEISIFPGSTNALKVQITRELVDVLHAYFVIKDSANKAGGEQQQLVPTSNSGTMLDMTKKSPNAADSNAITTAGRSEDVTVVSNLERQKLLGDVLEGTSTTDTKSKTRVSFARVRRWARLARGGRAGEGSQRSVDMSTSMEASTVRKRVPRKEALYVKYMRVGVVSVEVTTSGFPLNVKHHNAVLDPFVCHGKLFDWQLLVRRLESHMKWSLTKNTASISLSKIQRLFFRSPKPNTIALKQESEEELEDDIETKRVALLGIRL